MNAKLQLNLDDLSVATFETQKAPQPDAAKDVAPTCLNTNCPPYACCA